MRTKNINVYWIDLFCGAGGTSTGIHLASPYTKVIACVNHDANAISSHQENHPEAAHFTEDIRDFEVVKKLKIIVDRLRTAEPDCIISIWASLECTNFSKAKGGLPRDADSRTLAEHMFMYLEHLKPDYFWIENVMEFMSWGPLNGKGKPLSRTEGRDYIKWIDKVKSYGFKFDKKILNAADFGAYQSRKRYFAQFAKPEYPISWPQQTHTKDKRENSLFPMEQWKPVRNILDLSDEGISIFERKKALSENTLKRIYAGLEKFIAKGDTAFTKRYNGGKVNPEGKVNSLDRPMGTILSNCTHAIVSANHFIAQRHNGTPASRIVDINGPARTLTTTGGNQELVSAQHFISQSYGGNENAKVSCIGVPARTVTTTDNKSIATVNFLSTYYGKGSTYNLDRPSPTVTTKDRITKVDAQFIMNQYSNGGEYTDINGPSSTLTIIPKQNLVSATPWILNPAWGGNMGNIDNPCCTVVARQDKAPLYIVSAETASAHILIPVYETDSPVMVKIKEFMCAYGIVDIKMRMLKIDELKQIQGFPKDYILKGTQTEQKKYIGNAVEVTQATALTKTHYKSLLNHFKNLAA